MKKLLCLLLALTLVLLCACTGPEAGNPTDAPTDPTDAPTEPPTEPPTEAPTDPPVLYTDPLTGEPLSEPVYARPVAVMLNNYEKALPLHGASEASILFEGLTEGGMTRCMGIYSDIASVETLGSIRSARKHFVSVAISFDALYVHYGKSDIAGSEYTAKQYLDAMNWEHLDGTTRAGYGYFYENNYRHENGWPSDACHFLVGQRVIDWATDKNYALTRDEAFDYGWNFSNSSVIIGEKCNTLTAYFNQGGTPGKWTKSTSFQYDAESGQYMSFQFGKENVEGNNGEQLCFKNVIVLRAKTTKDPNSKLIGMELEGEGTGYFACNGQLVSIKWSRATAYDPFSFFLEDGTPLTLGIGKTYVALVPTNATFTHSAE